MGLVIETDLGHDPDDYFAILYLIAAGVDVRALFITPGDPDQIAIARLICDEVGLNIPIYAGKANRTKNSSGSIHHELLKGYGRPLEAEPDGLGREHVGEFEGNDLFIIGPLTSIGAYLRDNPEAKFGRPVMQGGFCPYSLYRPKKPLDKFEGKEFVQTFNLNGNRKGAMHFLGHEFKNRYHRFMVGKNICHTVEFNGDRFREFIAPPNRAAELFCEGARLYLARHGGKKFHDPTAACCYLHPEIGIWMPGKTVKMESGWTTEKREDSFGSDLILVDIDYDELWGSWE